MKINKENIKPKTYGAFNEFCHPDCPSFTCNPNNTLDCVCEIKPNLFITLDYYDGFLAQCTDMRNENE